MSQLPSSRIRKQGRPGRCDAGTLRCTQAPAQHPEWECRLESFQALAAGCRRCCSSEGTDRLADAVFQSAERSRHRRRLCRGFRGPSPERCQMGRPECSRRTSGTRRQRTCTRRSTPTRWSALRRTSHQTTMSVIRCSFLTWARREPVGATIFLTQLASEGFVVAAPEHDDCQASSCRLAAH